MTRTAPHDVERAALPDATVLGEVRDRHHAEDDADRDVDEEHPAPRELLDQDPAEQRAGRAAGTCDRAPHADRARELRAGERRHDDRERRGREDRAAEALDGACRGEPRVARREAAGEARAREDRESEDEHPLLAEQVRGAAAEEEEAREREDVGVHDPLQARRGVVQVATDRRQRDVHDGDVEDDHELRDARNSEDQTSAQVARGPRLHRDTLTGASDEP